MIENVVPRPWKLDRRQDCSVAYAGHIDDVQTFFSEIDTWARDATPFESTVQNIVETQNSCFGLLVETKNYYLCIVDHIRSYPIFYRTRPSRQPVLLALTPEDSEGVLCLNQ